MRTFSTSLACIASLAMLGSSAASATAGDPAATVAGAVRTLSAQRHGIIAFDVLYAYREHGPGHNTSREVDEIRLRNDGRLIALRILREVKDGKATAQSELAKEQAAANEHLPGDDYRLPVTAEALADYRFTTAPCAPCSPGVEAIAFTSLKRDDDHGDGMVFVDTALRHITRLTFAPSVLPNHVDSAAIVMLFGQVLPDLWDLENETQHYDGHVLFIHGGAEVTRTYGSYRRFATLEQGTAALRQ